MAEQSLDQQIEAILFVATAPVSAGQISQVTGAGPSDIAAAAKTLRGKLAGRGIQLVEHEDKYRLVSSPATAAVVKKFLQDESNSELSKAALETLAIIAYRGPVTKSAVESVRGVSSDTMLRNLQQRGLITEAGKSNEPGRPQLYAVSLNFLQHFGLSSIRDLPPLPEPARAD